MGLWFVDTEANLFAMKQTNDLVDTRNYKKLHSLHTTFRILNNVLQFPLHLQFHLAS